MKVALFSITGLLIPFVMSIPILDMDIHITDDTHVDKSLATSNNLEEVLGPTPITSSGSTSKEVPGWVTFKYKFWDAHFHGNDYWIIKGRLDGYFPADEYLIDPILFTLTKPRDLEGRFNGTVGDGRISLIWEDSGATMTGQTPMGDFEVSGESIVSANPQNVDASEALRSGPAKSSCTH